MDALESKWRDRPEMRRYRKYNPKRRLAGPGTHTGPELDKLAKTARYTGNPEHRRDPGDFNLTPPARRG